MPKTVLQMTREKWKKYRPRPRARIKETALISFPSISYSRDKALKVVKAAAELLRRRFSVNKIVMFNSTAINIGFSEFSDMDLSAWGIPVDQCY